MKKTAIALLLALAAAKTSLAVETTTPALYEDWKRALLGREGTDAEARSAAETRRASVAKLRDPFSRLFTLSCDERAALQEVIVWEDEAAMALVDSHDSGPKLLVVPKQRANFPVDLPSGRMAHLEKVAAAACEALQASVEASGVCSMYINTGVSLSQLHVHVRVSGQLGDAASHRRTVSARMQRSLGGTSCVAR